MSNKVIVMMIIFVVVTAGFVFAQSDTCQVQSVAGKVERQLDTGSWETVTKGMTLSKKDTVTTGLNSILVVKTGDRTVVIDSLKKGTIEELSVISAPGQKGIRAGRAALKSDAADKSGPDRTNISTASTRAEMKSNEIEWNEEDTEDEQEDKEN